jgi:hypothetical protein
MGRRLILSNDQSTNNWFGEASIRVSVPFGVYHLLTLGIYKSLFLNPPAVRLFTNLPRNQSANPATARIAKITKPTNRATFQTRGVVLHFL